MLLSSFKFFCYKRRVTFKDIYELWSGEYFDNIAESTKRTWRVAYIHCKALHELRFRNIKVWDLERTIRNENVGESTKVRMKCLFNKLYGYAIKHELVKKNVAMYCDSPRPVKKIERFPFSEEEIKMLWDNLDIPFVDMILVGIFLLLWLRCVM